VTNTADLVSGMTPRCWSASTCHTHFFHYHARGVTTSPDTPNDALDPSACEPSSNNLRSQHPHW